MTVGDTSAWLPELIERAKGLKVGNGFDPSTEMYVIRLISRSPSHSLGDPILIILRFDAKIIVDLSLTLPLRSELSD